MFYNADDLMALRAELAVKNEPTEKFIVRYNPWDLGAIWVLNPLDQRYLKATATDEAMAGMTEYQWKVIRRAVRERFDEPEHLLSLAASRNVIRDVVEAAVKKPSKRRRSRAARFLGPEAKPDPTKVDTNSDELAFPRDPNSETRQEQKEKTIESIDPHDLDVDDWEVA